MSVLVEVGDFMLVVNLLNFLFTSFHNLSLCGLFMRILSCLQVLA
jgi:hypothetical protein